MRARWPALLCLAALVVPGSARAAPASAHLSYSSADRTDCPNESAFRDAVAARLGYDPFHDEAGTEIVARIERAGGSLRGRVEVRDSRGAVRGTREVISRKNDCGELISTMALSVALALDPASLSRKPPTAPSPTPPPSPPPASSAPASPAAPPVAAPVVAEEVPTKETGRLDVRFGASGSLLFGATPGSSFAPSLLFGLGGRWLSVDIEGRYGLASSFELARGSIAASLWLVSLAPCVHVGILIGCVASGVGRLSGSGTGIDVPHEESAFYADIAARLGAEIPLVSHTRLRVFGETFAPIASTTLRLRNEEVWSTPALGASISAGAIGTFP